LKELILKDIENQKSVYLSDSARIIADYNNELETIKEYNGRQILELLQNADDEKSEEVLIELITNENILKISNRGIKCKPFSAKGIKSLMVSNFSPKITKKYIGNKGLGFRSIVNWSNKVTINSQNIDIAFSKVIAQRFYDEICDKQKHNEITKQRNLLDNVKPIAFLAVPSISDNFQEIWTTTINIEYKDEYCIDIKNQIENIQDEILLFVNNINTITIKIDENTKKIERLKQDNIIFVNDALWTIYGKNDLLPKELWDKENEEENYELKIAIQDDFDNPNNLLYSYFPTKIEIDFPFIIHGTFDLNSSRNDLNYNLKNKYVLEKLVELIIDTAKDITKVGVSYKALEFLSHNKENTTLSNLKFYDKIDEAITNLAIFPCVDNSYRKKDEVTYINDDFSSLILKTKNENIIPYLLIPNSLSINLLKYDLKKTVYTKLLNDFSKNIKNIEDRVDLIYIFYKTFQHEHQFVFLIDDENNLVNLDDEVYTPITKDFDLNIPSYVKIKFINNELFEKLLDKFEINSNEKHRDLQRELKKITNIQTYEPAQILQKIVTSTNKVLENAQFDKNSTIKSMISSLYMNYKVLSSKTKIPDNTRIQLINKDGSIENANNLFLSKSYPSGNLTESLFGNIFGSNLFLADIEIFNFERDDNIEQIEQFFLWLGVNRYTKFIIETNDFHYNKYLLKKLNTQQSISKIIFEMKKVSYFSKIKEISIEKIILWILQDQYMREELYSQNSIRYIKSGGYVKYLLTNEAPSYVLYQLKLSKLFKNYLITNEKLSLLVNQNSIDYNYELFKKYEIKKPDIDSMILKIGAVDKFENLSIEAVRDILKHLPQKSPDGKQTLTIYKEAIEHYKKHKKPLNNQQILICAKKNGNFAYHPQGEVYYNGNIKLPRKITHSKAIINFPRRQNTRNVIDFFGIKNLSSINIRILNQNIAVNLSQKFQLFFIKIIPYILALRLEDSITESSRKKDLSNIRNASIQLCYRVTYKIDDDDFELENNDYIKGEKIYYIKIDTSKSFGNLRKELDFRETFTDIIGSIFDITDTDKYSRLISDNIQETEELIKRNVGYDSIVRAREHLGISDELFSFWKTIYSLMGKEYSYNSDKKLLQKITDVLCISTEINHIDYKNLQSLTSCIYIEKLFNELGIDIEHFNGSSSSFYKLDFKFYHAHRLKECFNDNYYHFKQLLYHWCDINSKEKDFINLLGIYEHNEETIFKNTKLNINYQKIVNKFVSLNFKINLKNNICKNIDFEQLYEQNKKIIDFEKIESSNEYRSLLYFKNKLEEIKNIIKKINLKNKYLDDSNNSNNNKKIKTIVPVNLISPENINKKHTPKKTYKHSQERNRKNKICGDNAEQDVFISLVHEMGKENVEWKSKDDDTLGYDIRYKIKNNTWKHVEVKTFSKGIFHLTKNEKEFAEKNKESYEIFLVGEEIYKITDVDFLNSMDFKLVPCEYEVLYKINV
jgi:Protein NO VEIN, C-terminal